MTGIVFASLSKYIEVGNILNAKDEPVKHIEELKQLVLKPQTTGKEPKRRSIHYSTVQNRPVSYETILHMKNHLMLNINIPKYFTLDLPQEVGGVPL